MNNSLKYIMKHIDINDNNEIEKITEILEEYYMNNEDLRSTIYNLNINKDKQDIELLDFKNSNLILEKENTQLKEINNKLKVSNKMYEMEITLIENETNKFKIENNKFKIENENLRKENKTNNNLMTKINNLHEENNKLNIQLLDNKSLISIAEDNLEEQYNITIKLNYQIKVNKLTITKLNNKIIDLELDIYRLGNDNFNLYIILIYIIYCICFLLI